MGKNKEQQLADKLKKRQGLTPSQALMGLGQSDSVPTIGKTDIKGEGVEVTELTKHETPNTLNIETPSNDIKEIITPISESPTLVEDKTPETNSSNEPETSSKKSNRGSRNKENKDLKGSLADIFKKNPSMEDSHTRMTFWIRNDIKAELDSLFDELGQHGAKKKFINTILENALAELKGIQKG